MQFFTVFDLLEYKANQKNIKTENMVAFFKGKGITKTQLLQMRQTSYYPTDGEFVQTILGFLEMSELEFNMLLGKIPPEYEDSYIKNVARIASILEVDKSPRKVAVPVEPFFKSDSGTLYNGDCIEVMQNLADSSIDLIFADPPFNLNKDYDDGVCDDLSMTDYLNWSTAWIRECIRILKPGGYFFVYNIPKWCTYIAGYLNQYLTFWDWIAVDMKYRLPINRRLYPAHYGLLAYIKGTTPTTFNNQRMPLQTCRHCGGDVKDYGGYKSKMNHCGVNVSDVWSDIYPVRHKSTKNRKYNELPVKLLDRVLSLGTVEGNIVFDPFGGSGTTYAVAELLKRRWIGCEIGNCAVIVDRLQDLSNDERQIRKINEDKGVLFTEQAQKLRKKNGFWLTD